MRYLTFLLLPFVFSYLYNVTFLISENYIKINYCCFGKETGILYFNVNGINYSIKIAPKKVNTSDFLIERVEKLLKEGKEIEIWEVLNEPGMINYKDFTEMEKELREIKRLLQEGYFCDEFTLYKDINEFSSKNFGKYLIRVSDNKIIEINQQCDQRYKISGMFYCVIENGKNIEIKIKDKVDKTLIIGGVIWITTFALILISLKKK